MATKNKKSDTGPNPESPATGRDARQQQKDYTPPTPEEAKEHFEKYLKYLPPELSARISRFNTTAIADVLNGDNVPPGLEGFLPSLKVVDAATILNTEYPPLAWIIPDYLPPGLTFLIGKPKVGKSWLALQLALSISTGGKVFDRDVQRGRVLYLALEDNERRLQDRMKKQNWISSPQNVDFMLSDTFREQITALNTGGGKRLLRYIDKQKYRLVIVDTFSRAIQGDQLDPGEMTEAVGHLQQYALAKNIALIIIDHMPKNTGEINDPIGHIYGSVAKAGVTDTAWGLYKEQGKAGAKLGISGRDVDEFLLKLSFEKRGFYWHCEGNATEVAMTEQRKAILDILEEIGPAEAKAIADATGQPLNHIYRKLNDMANDGKISRKNDGKIITFSINS